MDGTLVGNAEVPYTTPFELDPGALTCGANPGSPISDDYASPFKFTGTIHSVTVDVSGKLIDDPEAELRMTWPASSGIPTTGPPALLPRAVYLGGTWDGPAETPRHAAAKSMM